MLQGKFIGVRERKNTFVLEKKFSVQDATRATLRITALGLYFAEINGVRVGDCCLTPGWTSYRKTLQVQEYAVEGLLHSGENTITLTVNTGWYCGQIGWERRTETYGVQSAVCADLILPDRMISTDETWEARESYIRESGIYDGETQDFTADCKPLTICEVVFDKSVLVPQISEPVRNIERLAVKEIIHTPKGELVYDFGQNMAGVVEIRTPEEFNGTLTLQFAEILVNGKFYTDNLRGAKATDTFTVKGAQTLVPEFTYHGFRYLKITGAKLPKENITAIVRHTDMKRSGSIQTDNARFNRLMENVVWGQKSNFVDIPTDCPQRDERLGWTGDINAFCTTAAYNYDIRAFMRKWLTDLRNDQSRDGRISHVVPHCLGEESRATDAIWADAITMVPYKLYEMYGDIGFLSENFGAMKKFIAAREQTMQNGLIVRGHEYGDWLAMDGEQLFAKNPVGRTDVYFLTNALHAHSLEIVADTATILGDSAAEKRYRSIYDAHLKRMRKEYFTANGRLCFDTVTAQAVALYYGIAEEKHRAKLAETLNRNVIARHYCVVTGFIGTPCLLFALSDNGYFETARRLLFYNGCPGWLYEVDMGATTVWERWNSLLSDGTPNPEGMNSYNHYAYGSVMEFVYRRIAGIEPKAAGFASVRIMPRPCKGLTHMRAEYDGVRGKIISEYIQSAGKIIYRISIPEGTDCEVALRGEPPIFLKGGNYSFERYCEDLSYEPFTPDCAVSEVFENPKAVRAFNEAFDHIFTGSEIAWMKSEHKSLQFMAEFRDTEGKMKLSDFPARLKRANELFDKI